MKKLLNNPERAAYLHEVANSISHGIAFLLSIPGLIVLVYLASVYGDIRHVACASVYGASMVILYAASTLYHAFRNERLKRIFQIVDHCAIYLLIAGTYTPFTVLLLKDTWGWGLSIAIWSLAFIGIVFKLFYTGKFEAVSTITYVLMGWLVLVAAKPMLESVPTNALLWLAAGGVSYTAGVIFYAWNKLPFNHTIWHLFVIGGSACHYCAILFYTMPGIG